MIGFVRSAADDSDEDEEDERSADATSAKRPDVVEFKYRRASGKDMVESSPLLPVGIPDVSAVAVAGVEAGTTFE